MQVDSSRFGPATWVLAATLMALTGCERHYSTTPTASAGGTTIFTTTPTPRPGMRVTDVTGKPIAGAIVTVTDGITTVEETTAADGWVLLSGAPSGQVVVSIRADGFEQSRFGTRLPGGVISTSLNAEGAWAVGRPIVLATRAVERASDGSTLTFSVDMSVVDERGAGIETLSADAFKVVTIDCGWGGPRDCASDDMGREPPGGINFIADGGVRAFGLQPPSARRAYAVDVLVERSQAIKHWDTRKAALESFFTTLGGNDIASLSTIRTFGGAPLFEALGPFTSDGRVHVDALAQLASTDSDVPDLSLAIMQAIQRAAAARDAALTRVEPNVVVLATPWISTPEFTRLADFARQQGVRVSVVASYNYGLPEIAVRTGGFVADHNDPRQLTMIAAALDALLAGTLPYYRLEFRIKGAPNTFVSGGNAKVNVEVQVPRSMPAYAPWAMFDVAIP